MICFRGLFNGYDSIVFDKVQDIIEPYEAEILKNRNFEATEDHRMWLKPNSPNSKTFKEYRWGNVLDGKKQYIIKPGAAYHGKGLDLSDDELRLLVWIQGDGHYMKDSRYGFITGIEFHLAKQRKINRVSELLESIGVKYSTSFCKNKSCHLRIYEREIVLLSYKFII